MKSIGLDFGSVYTKAVVVDDDGDVGATLYRKKGPDDLPALLAFLDGIDGLCPGERFRIGLVGLDARASFAKSILVSNAILAIARGVRRSHPVVQSVIEIGGHTAKFIVLDPIEGGVVRDFATNEACAAGTGSFLEQQAKRLDLTAEQLSSLSLEASDGVTIAGRCSVFAKSDMIHLQQKGTPAAEIAYGLCLAICRNALTTLIKGRSVEPPLMIAGGCSANRGILRAFSEILALGDGELLVSARPGLEAAVGAASAASEASLASFDTAEIRRLFEELMSIPRSRPDISETLSAPVHAVRPAEPADTHDCAVEAYLGADVGSVSTDLVLMDGRGALLSSVYLPTRGRPVDVLLEGLSIVRARFPAGLTILGCGATGSGRHLAARLLGADVVKNEITCQMLGARHFVPDVDTILEIGGQDSKFLALREGMLSDFAMNKICAAGTGSFLEEQAREMGIEIQRDFARRAFASAAPLDLGSRCTVFMETEVVNALRNGASVEDICAGLAYSIVKNYLDKVVGLRALGKNIVFQGGVASNDAVVAAFERVLGIPVQVHPYNRISGAIGAAIAARDAAREGVASSFRDVSPDARPVLRSFECRHCSNRCEVNVVRVARETAFFGDTCERYTSRASGSRDEALPPNLVEEYVRESEGLFDDRGGSGLTIGVPRASIAFGSLAFWATFFRSLGHRPVLSPPSSDEVLRLGLKHLSVGVCLPIKLAAGHAHALIARGVDLVFVPAVVLLPGGDLSSSYSCPYAMAVPFIIGAGDESRFFTPVISMEGEESFVERFSPHREQLGATRNSIRAAWREAARVQQELDETFRDRARKLLDGGGYRHAFALLGKPYNSFDSYMNMNLFERFRRLGILSIPQRFLPIARDGGSSELPWRFSADLDITAKVLGSIDGLDPVIISSFGCGPDAFTFRRISEALEGRSHLILEFDEHRGEAGLVTRIEAFLDQLESRGRRISAARELRVRSAPTVPPPGSAVRIPYFADQAHAFAGLLRLEGHDARVLPPPTPHTRELGERCSLGKECHAYAMLAGDLLELSRNSGGEDLVFFFPGTSLPCLLHQYGAGMRGLLRELGIANVTVCAPSGSDLVAAYGIDPLERFYLGLLSIELLVKAVCQIRPYELEQGMTDEIHRENLEQIASAIAEGDVLVALDEALERLGAVPIERERNRPVVGIAGDVYTKSNWAANHDLTRWLEGRGFEVWPSPFQIDLVDFGISRRLSESVAKLDLPGLLLHGSVAARREIDQWRVRNVVGSRITRKDEPGYLEMKELTARYMPNESHELLFINVAKIVDFARHGADGIVNAICFNCMIGNASAAIIEKIRRDHDAMPIITAVYSGGEDPSRRMVLEAFASQVAAHHERRVARRAPTLAGGASRLAAAIWPLRR